MAKSYLFLVKIPVFSLILQNFTINLINVTYMSSYIHVHKAFLKKTLFITNYLIVMNILNIDMQFVIFIFMVFLTSSTLMTKKYKIN